MDDKKDVFDLNEGDPILKEIYQKPKARDKYKDKKTFSKIRNAINKKKKRSTPKKG